MAVQIPPSIGSGNFEGGKGRPIVKYRTLCGHLGKNDRTNRDAVWAMGSDGPKESCAKWGLDRHGKGQFWGKGAPIVKYRDTAVTCTKTAEPFIANVNSRSRSLYAIARPSDVCLSSVVCNVRAPYSGGSNFRQYFYGIRYLGHPLASTENFTEIVPGKPLRRGS